VQKKIPSGICRNNEEAAGNAPLSAPTRQLKTVGSPLWLPQIRVPPSIFSILPFLVLETPRARVWPIPLVVAEAQIGRFVLGPKSGDRPQAHTQVFRIKVFSYWDPRSSQKPKTHKKFPITPVPLLFRKKVLSDTKKFCLLAKRPGESSLTPTNRSSKNGSPIFHKQGGSFSLAPSRAGDVTHCDRTPLATGRLGRNEA